MLAVVLVILSIFAVLALVRTVLNELRPSEIDLFRNASDLTSAWSRGEEWPPAAYPEEPAAQRSSTPEQGLSRSSRT